MPMLPDGTPLPYPDDDPAMMGGGTGGPDQSGDPWQRIIEAAQAAVEEDGTVTAQEMVLVEQIRSLIAKLRAGREKEQQAALGGGPATQFLRRAAGG